MDYNSDTAARCTIDIIISYKHIMVYIHMFNVTHHGKFNLLGTKTETEILNFLFDCGMTSI